MNDHYKNNQNILADSLFQLCSLKSTGTLFILSHQNTSAQILLQDGEIIALSFDTKHGLDAIEDFKNANYARFHFIKEFKFPLTKADDIDCSRDVLSQLGFNEFLNK